MYTKNPKWQRRRLEIMARDKFTCQSCGATDKELNVHHKRYMNGRDYWDYEDWELTTLCKDCHEARHLKPWRIPESEKTDLDRRRESLVDQVTNDNYREIFPAIMAIDKQRISR